MAVDTTYDPAVAETFGEKVFADFTGMIALTLASIGDRLGLFKTLADGHPQTSQELADRSGISERYAREWLNGMFCAGYLEHDVAATTFRLPAAHVPALADEGGPAFMGGPFQEYPAILKSFDHLVDAFRSGGGVSQSQIDPAFWEGMERESAGIFNHILVQEWIPLLPDVTRKLERGALAADIGCGSGRAAIALARAFPSSNIVGYDNFEPQLARARENVIREEVSGRVRFDNRDVTMGIPGEFDVITSIDVVHDALDPVGLMRAIRKGLKPDGIYVMVEPATGESVEDNVGPIGTYLYGASILYCMTTSLSEGGAGLGTAGLPESKVRTLAADAGFGAVRRAELDDPFHAIYELRP